MKKALLILLVCHSLLSAVSIGAWKNIRFSYLDKYQARAYLRTELQSEAPLWVLYDSYGGVNQEKMNLISSNSNTWEGVFGMIHGDTKGCNIGLLSGEPYKPVQLVPVYVEADSTLDPLYLSPFSTDPEDPDVFPQLDILRDYVALSDSTLYVGMKTRGSSTFYADATGELMFSYMAILAKNLGELSDPQATTWILFAEVPELHMINGLYRMTGNDPEQVRFIAPIQVKKGNSAYPFLLSVNLQQLCSEPAFKAWYNPKEPVFALKTVTCLTDKQEAALVDESPGGLVYPRRLFFDAKLTQQAEIGIPEFHSTPEDAWFQVSYANKQGRFVRKMELNYKDDLNLPMYPLGFNYWQPVTYRTENLKPRFAGNEILETYFRYSTLKNSEIRDTGNTFNIAYDPYKSLPFEEFNQATGLVGKAQKTPAGCLRSFSGTFPRVEVKSLKELESKLPQLMSILKPFLRLEPGVEPVFTRASQFDDRILGSNYVYNEDDELKLEYFVNSYHGYALDSQLTGAMSFSFDRQKGDIVFCNNYPYLDLEEPQPRLSEDEAKRIFSEQLVSATSDSLKVQLRLVNPLGKFNFSGHNPARFVWEISDQNETALIDDLSGKFIRKYFHRLRAAFPYTKAWQVQEALDKEMKVLSRNWFDMQFWENGRLRKVTLKLPDEIARQDEPDAEKMRLLIQKFKSRFMPVEFTFIRDRDSYDKDKRYLSQWKPLRPSFGEIGIAGDRLTLSYDAGKGTVVIDNSIVDHEIPLGMRPVISKDEAIKRMAETVLQTNYSTADYSKHKAFLQLVYQPAIPDLLYPSGQDYGIVKPAADYRLMWTLIPTANAEIAIDAISGKLIYCNPEKTE